MNREDKRLSEMILSYLRRYPGAGDTLEGITKWWLALERIDATVEEVADVVRQLTESGIISFYEGHGGAVYYKIANK